MTDCDKLVPGLRNVMYTFPWIENWESAEFTMMYIMEEDV
jgi:hypothetical protein